MNTAAASLLLVRHGRTIADGKNGALRLNGWTNCPLHEQGVEQARFAALRLRGASPFACVYSSPLRRAFDTARAIADAAERELCIFDGLREIHCGELEGMDVREVERQFPRLWAANLEQNDESFRWPGGESYREFRARSVETITAIAKRHPGGRVVVVTHAGVVNQLIGHVLGISPARWEPFRPGNASITEIEWFDGRGELVRFDDQSHLGRAQGIARSQITVSRVHRPDG